KSTIINRFQHEIRKTNDILSLYIDVKSIYIQAKESSPQLSGYDVLTQNEKEKYFIYLEFLKKIIEEIKKEINKAIFTNKLSKYIFGGITEKDFKKDLDSIFKNKTSFEDITALKTVKNIDENKLTKTKENSRTINTDFEPKIEIKTDGVGGSLGKSGIEFSKKDTNSKSELNSEEYSSVLIRYFNIIDLMNQIKGLLEKLNIKVVYICLDDASELEKDALETFGRTIISPLNNSSEGFFKFKISFYPGRDVLPNIDRTKVETINIDYYNLYQSSGVDKVEE